MDQSATPDSQRFKGATPPTKQAAYPHQGEADQPNMAPRSPKTLVGVQALRGIAALLVVITHAAQMVQSRLGAGQLLFFGASGVDFFFPISGFVMVVTTYANWGKPAQAGPFLAKRLIRIVPLYWAATLFKAVATLAVPGLTYHPRLDWWHIAASLAFIPAWDSDHKAFPLLPVGWTLNFEMLFYVLFAIALALRVRPIIWVGVAMLALSFLPRFPALGAVGSLANPIVLEFVGGMAIGLATVKGKRIPTTLAWLGLALSLSCVLFSQFAQEFIVVSNRVLFWGVPGCVALASVIALEVPFERWFDGIPRQIGDASYAIYLVHGFVLPAVGLALSKTGFTGYLVPSFGILSGCFVSTIAGILVHRGFEQPVTKYLSQFRQT